MVFARNRLKELLSLDIGVLILDLCYNTALAHVTFGEVVLNLNGTKNYCYNGSCFDRTKIVGLIGDVSSHVAITVSFSSSKYYSKI